MQVSCSHGTKLTEKKMEKSTHHEDPPPYGNEI